MKKLTCIDLFAGAGGLSEGFMQTDNYKFLAHVEWEKPMVDTLRNNLCSRWGYTPKMSKETVVRFDIQKTDELLFGNWSHETKEEYSCGNSEKFINGGLNAIISNKEVDVIIGGPPCQAYSIAGRAQDVDSMKFDYRNYLFESFVKVVNYYRPKAFVFENVPGILSAKPGDKLVIERIYDAFLKIGYKINTPGEMKNAIFSAADFLVPQNRRRVIIFGIRNDLPIEVKTFYNLLRKNKSNKVVTVKDAIGDLPKFIPLESQIKRNGKNISHISLEDNLLSHHQPRYINPRDIRAFREWLENSMNNKTTEKKLDFYTKITGKNSNHVKYRNLEWDKPSPTIVSHLYKDGLMFIHPDIEQLRSITIREAAILQSFPNDYDFIGSAAYCYKMIGNAVPILFAKNIGQSVTDVLKGEK